MKLPYLIISLILLALPAGAQKETQKKAFGYGVTFLEEGESMPDALYYLPAPPEFGTEAFINDSIVYEEGKRLRLTARGDTAVMDVNTSIPYYFKRFSPAIGKELTEEKYPVLAKTLRGVLQDVRGGIQHAKNTFARHRPYQHFNESTPIPEDEHPADFTSYPSGHTVRAWAAAMLLTAIYPESGTEIMRIGYDLGASRTIAGFHYQSDVDAARLCAGAGFARLCAKKSFLKALMECRKEARKK
ncbi:MAG: phosphatase PAP2 family protein [Bacteroidales bacterium]|nr:phosphatase PAP2 family protein [Bacteroidales bacterium]MCM1146608.1 phosphatase PAP2 family protein [Bacteroidales bacterium]MCM1206000.1 phosphatase PAP2 family protein [Bacillota bacterium]MCM1510118.1 phosphatase PAP2 family protein [Clostridium sp.]